MSKSKISFLIFTSFAAVSLAACGAADHGHDHGSTDNHDHAEAETADHSKFGHMSAVYLCGDEELQTSHTDAETTLAYKGLKIDVSRKVSVIDSAFAGETFKGKFRGQNLTFKGIGYDASLTLDDEVIACEKITCIPLGGPH